MSNPPRPKVEDVDEDLDDLDDVISEFTPSAPKNKISSPPPTTTTATTIPSAPNTTTGTTKKDAHDLAADNDFVNELAKGMEDLMRELTGMDAGTKGDGEGGDDELTEEQRLAFKAAWEKMLLEELDQGSHGADQLHGEKDKKADGKGKGKDGSVASAAASGTSRSGTSKKPATSYQDSLKQVMDNVRESEELFKDMNFDNETDEGLFKQLLELSKGDLNEGDSEEIQDMLMGMLNTILSKEVLYEPIIELRNKFPAYLAENGAKLPKEDLDRYKLQLECVTELGKIFEDPQYNDKNEETKARVSTLVEKLQGYGSPPSELTGPIPPGLPGGADLPEGCIIS